MSAPVIDDDDAGCDDDIDDNASSCTFDMVGVDDNATVDDESVDEVFAADGVLPVDGVARVDTDDCDFELMF